MPKKLELENQKGIQYEFIIFSCLRLKQTNIREMVYHIRISGRKPKTSLFKGSLLSLDFGSVLDILFEINEE